MAIAVENGGFFDIELRNRIGIHRSRVFVEARGSADCESVRAPSFEPNPLLTELLRMKDRSP